MDVIINGEPRVVPDGLTVVALIAHLRLDGPVAVEVNQVIVPRARHAETRIQPGDVLEIVAFVGGG